MKKIIITTAVGLIGGFLLAQRIREEQLDIYHILEILSEQGLESITIETQKEKTQVNFTAIRKRDHQRMAGSVQMKNSEIIISLKEKQI